MNQTRTHRRAGTYAWYVAGVLLAVSILGYIDRLILSFLVEPIKASLHLRDAQIGMITGVAFAVLYAVAGLPLGRLMDRANRPVVLSLCILAWSFGTAYCGLSASFIGLFLARVAVGTGEAGLGPAAVSLIGDYFAGSQVEKPLGMFSSGLYLGGGAALMLGGALFGYLSAHPSVSVPGFGVMAPWRAIFIIMGVPGLLVAALVAVSIREPRRKAATNAESASLSEALGFARRNRNVLLPLIISVVAWGFNGYGLLNWYPAMLQRTYGVSPHVVAWTYGPAFLIGGTLGSISVAPAVIFMARRGNTSPLFSVAIWTLVGMTIATAAAPLMPGLPGAILFAFLTLLFSSMTVTVNYSIIALVVPGRLRGLYTAAYMAIMNVTGGAFGAVLVGLLTDHWLGAAHLNLAIDVMAITFGPLSILLMRRATREYRRRPMQMAMAGAHAQT